MEAGQELKWASIPSLPLEIAAIEEVISEKIMIIPVVKKDHENGQPKTKKETLVKTALEIMGVEVEG